MTDSTANGTRLEKGQCDLNDLISVERAHDVRTLRGCAHCGGLGHNTQMIDGTPFAGEKGTPWFHGRCFAEKFGEAALLGMGRIRLDRLCIGDLGTRLMRAVVDRVNGGQS